MNHIENIFFCLAAPLVVAVFCVPRFPRRSILFIISGMAACLLSSYISNFFARLMEADALGTSLEISPLVEEVLKLVPVAFYMMAYEPEKNEAASEALMVAVGFATLENAFFMLTNNTGNTAHLMIRAFSNGAMHVVCGAVTAVVLRGLWDSQIFRVIATIGTLCLAITFHGIYNVLVNQQGSPAYIGYALPVLIGIGTIILRRKMYGSSTDYMAGTPFQRTKSGS